MVYEKITDYLYTLPCDIEIEDKFLYFFEMRVNYIDDVIDSYYDDNSYSSSFNQGSDDENKEIEFIFTRK